MSKNNEVKLNSKKNEFESNYGIEYIVKPPLKTELCEVLWKNEKGFAFLFKDFGITFNSKKLDLDLIPKMIEIEYENEIGEKDFKYYPKFK